MLVAVVLVLAVVVGTWALLRDDGAAEATTPSARTPTPAATSTLDHLCADVAPDMPLRVDSLRRTEAAVRAVAKALRSEGNAEAANAAKDLAAALAALATALDTQGDTQAATTAMLGALGALPC